MKAVPLKIKAIEIAPNGNLLSQDIFSFLEEVFKANPLVRLEENGYYYTEDSINELADDIVTIMEKNK